jgi:hypothetical protein
MVPGLLRAYTSGMRTLLLSFPLLATLACGSNSSTDAGTDSSTDSSTTDGTTGSDGSATDGSMTNDTGTNTDAGPLVAECQTLAKNFETKCSGSNPRPCVWQAYGKLCATTPKLQLLVDSMKCLDASTCRIFSDPNQGAACLAAAHQAGQSPAAKKAIEDGCTACGGSNCSTVTGQVEVIPYLSDSEIAQLAACKGNACTIDALIKACGNVPNVGLFTACVN